MMKMIDFIWPEKWIPHNIRFFLVIAAAFVWGFVFYLKYFVFHVGGVLQFGGIFLILIIRGYLFNGALPMPPASPEFEEDNLSLQVGRSIIFWVSTLLFLGMNFIADWRV